MDIEYRIKNGDIPEYELKILKSGCCKALLPGSYFSTGGEYILRLDPSGYGTLKTRLDPCGTAVLDGFRLTLNLLRNVLEASVLAKRYLIPEQDISLAAEDLFFGSDGRAGLMLKAPDSNSSAPLPERMIALCREIFARYPVSNAGAIAERLEAENRTGLQDEKRMLRLLSLWEIELNR